MIQITQRVMAQHSTCSCRIVEESKAKEMSIACSPVDSVTRVWEVWRERHRARIRCRYRLKIEEHRTKTPAHPVSPQITQMNTDELLSGSIPEDQHCGAGVSSAIRTWKMSPNVHRRNILIIRFGFRSDSGTTRSLREAPEAPKPKIGRLFGRSDSQVYLDCRACFDDDHPGGRRHFPSRSDSKGGLRRTSD